MKLESLLADGEDQEEVDIREDPEDLAKRLLKPSHISFHNKNSISSI